MNRGMFMGLGGCLVFIGFVLRGLATGHRREQARRKQHELDAGAPDPEHAPDAIDRHLARWLPRYGAACITAGFAAIAAGLFG